MALLARDNIFYTRKNKKHPNATHRKAASVCLKIKRSCKTKAVGRDKLEQTYKKYFFMTAENGLPIKYNKGKKEIIFHLFSDRDSKMNPFIRRVYGSD